MSAALLLEIFQPPSSQQRLKSLPPRDNTGAGMFSRHAMPVFSQFPLT